MNKPIIIIVNGRPGSGKDTFADMLNNLARVKKMSIIDLSKEIADMAGWDGRKSDRSRQFLSDIKNLIDQFNDSSFKSISKSINRSIEADCWDYILVDARRLEDISRIKKEFGAISLYIENNRIKHIPTNIDDMDARVGGDFYDITICNNGTLDEFRKSIKCLHKDLDKFGVEQVIKTIDVYK